MRGLGVKKSRDGLDFNIVKVVLLVIFTNFLLSSFINHSYNIFCCICKSYVLSFYTPSFFPFFLSLMKRKMRLWIWGGDQGGGVRSLMGDLSFGVVRKHVLRQIVDVP
ncbi:LOW QUALITY PROTEIN: hypothetical protein TorRG33x02_061070 [Trema orientale]|uniref:Transmembrane protein n=1 Tax=Trema orientale TaxID=63057 RepID=A0A2P5FJT2_TREOI|nr:LOW QUALITY PROTEIN: hypothetical protein TorRG33x02_061070 [Trema orientale]